MRRRRPDRCVSTRSTSRSSAPASPAARARSRLRKQAGTCAFAIGAELPKAQAGGTEGSPVAAALLDTTSHARRTAQRPRASSGREQSGSSIGSSSLVVTRSGERGSSGLPRTTKSARRCAQSSRRSAQTVSRVNGATSCRRYCGSAFAARPITSAAAQFSRLAWCADSRPRLQEQAWSSERAPASRRWTSSGQTRWWSRPTAPAAACSPNSTRRSLLRVVR